MSDLAVGKNMVASDIGLEKTRIEIKDLARREVLAEVQGIHRVTFKTIYG